jgi:hypothetical protein
VGQKGVGSSGPRQGPNARTGPVLGACEGPIHPSTAAETAQSREPLTAPRYLELCFFRPPSARLPRDPYRPTMHSRDTVDGGVGERDPSHLMIVIACLTPIKTPSCSASNSPSKSFQAERQSPQISLNWDRQICAMSQRSRAEAFCLTLVTRLGVVRVS